MPDYPHVPEPVAYQQVLNSRPIPPHHLQRKNRHHIPITARIVWSVDGEELIECEAADWVGRDVLVWGLGTRCRTRGVWVDVDDVERR